MHCKRSEMIVHSCGWWSGLKAALVRTKAPKTPIHAYQPVEKAAR
jgi:hypothetical protein